MADNIKSNELPLTISNGLFIQPAAKELPLSINRKLGSLDSYNYVYAGKLPLRIERRISDRPSSSTLPLSINRPYNTILPARYVSAKVLPLAILTSLSDKPHSKSLPLAINRELGTLVKEEIVKPKPKVQDIAPVGWASSVLGLSSLRFLNMKLYPIGIDSSLYGQPNIRAEVAEGYFPASRLKLPIAVDRSIRPSSSELPLGIYREHGQWLNKPDIKPTNRRYLYPKTFVDGLLSKPNISLYQQYVLNSGIGSLGIGSLGIKSSKDFIDAQGWQSSVLGATASIVNRNQRIITEGFDSSEYGYSKSYNLKQFVEPSSQDYSLYGTAYLLGGVKYLTPNGVNSNIFGELVVTNTTANQEARPQGIDSLVVPALSVSPRILYATGINSLSVGVPEVRDPSLKPLGETHTSYGTPTIWYHTRPLAPTGILAYESGYLRIADPTQFVQAPSLIESAIFGDTAIRNLSFKVGVKGIDESSFSDYSTLTNSNRYYAPKGISSLSVGAATIYNKTPSVFVPSIAPYNTGVPAIGHAIRFVQPSGFDRLLFGLPVLIKAPELLVSGHQDSTVSSPTVWYKNRTIDLNARGIDSFRADNQTVWFGLRPIKPDGWVSSSHTRPQITHGVRTVEPQGFRIDVLGYSWVSQGTRALEPEGIYKEFPTNVLVGGTQTVKPAGYEATLWGERIIPISQSVRPLGFREVWGNATADLFTKYIVPAGYISVGQQPADRWGDIAVYNKLQYIVQNFDINSGLVPPSWPDYMLIENRNKTIGVTSFVATKFGYSQIDNNAAPLLPIAILPPPITIGMISHGIRTVSPEAIENPPMLDWSVIYNAGRVIAPPGVVNTNMGQPAVANTRRYYSGVGRFESLETGTPMIAYRIRTIDIEPRYSIAPPQINLPTIDLYTRYVGFNGYETVKYGLPSLSIHFNIIGPSWAHRDDFGYGAVRNVTPELQVGAFDSQEFGNAGIRTQWRHVQAQGDTATLFGLTKIADRKQFIVPGSWQDGSASQKHTVIRTGAPPYTPQNIWLQNESNPNEDGFGIKPSSAPSTPGVNQNVIYAYGFDAKKFGDTKLHSNNLYIDIGISTKNVGTGTAVFNKNRFINPNGINNTIEVSERLAVTPFYIRPRGFNHADDGITFSRTKMGYLTVTNQHRAIYPQGATNSSFGYGHNVTLQTRYIEPPTIRGYAMGFPEIPFTPKTIDAKDYGFNSEVYGKATVAYPPYTGPQTAEVKGIDSFSAGYARVELLHREVQAHGHDSLRMGYSIPNDTPYMWQGLRVGEFVPMSIGAGDTSLFGKTAIGLRVREIPVEGFVAFRSEYEPVKFKDRMKVTRSNGSAEDNLIQSINAIGIKSEVTGAVEVKWGQQFIRPDGNSNQFRKGGYHA